MFQILKHLIFFGTWVFVCSGTAFAQTHDGFSSSEPAPIEATSPNFILLGTIEPQSAQSLLTDLEEFRAAVLDIFKGPTGVETDKIIIHYIADYDDFDAVAPSANISALYFQSVLGPRILVNAEVLGYDRSRIKRALFHEYMHHLNFHYLGYKIPVWLNEGLAEYYATFKKTPEGNYLVGQSLDEYFRALDTSRWTPVTTLFDALHEYPYEPGATDNSSLRSQSFFYAQSWLIVHYLKNLPGGREKLKDFVQRLDPLRSSEEAFIELFEVDYIDFEQALKSYLEDTDISYEILTPTRSFVDVPISIRSIDEPHLLAERYLVYSLLYPYVESSIFLRKASAELREVGRSFASVHIANISNAIQEMDYDKASSRVKAAKSLYPDNENISHLAALVTYGSVTEQNASNLRRVQGVLRDAIAENPEELRLRAYLLTTFPPKGSATNLSVKEQLDYLIAANFEVRIPELSTIIVPYLEAAEHYEVSDRALDIAEIWLPEAQNRSEAYRMKVDLTYSRP